MKFLILIISSLLLLFTNLGVTSFSSDTNVLDNQRLSEKTTLNKKYKKALENEQPYYCQMNIVRYYAISPWGNFYA